MITLIVTAVVTAVVLLVASLWGRVREELAWRSSLRWLRRNNY